MTDFSEEYFLQAQASERSILVQSSGTPSLSVHTRCVWKATCFLEGKISQNLFLRKILLESIKDLVFNQTVKLKSLPECFNNWQTISRSSSSHHFHQPLTRNFASVSFCLIFTRITYKGTDLHFAFWPEFINENVFPCHGLRRTGLFQVQPEFLPKFCISLYQELPLNKDNLEAWLWMQFLYESVLVWRQT